MAVFFNSVSSFVEAVGRRTTNDKRNTLDRITTIWTGPSAGALAFTPANGTPHPEFPLMLCEKSSILAMAGLVAEVRVDYIGKLAGGSDTGIYRTTPDINRSRHLGSISYSTTASLSDILLATTSWVVRFTAKSVSFRYLTNEVLDPDFDGYFVSEATPYLGVENVVAFRAGLSYATGAPSSGYVQSTLTYENVLDSLNVEDQDNGWYTVTENFITQAYIDTEVVGVPSPSGTSSTTYQYPNSTGTGWAS